VLVLPAKLVDANKGMYEMTYRLAPPRAAIGAGGWYAGKFAAADVVLIGDPFALLRRLLPSW